MESSTANYTATTNCYHQLHRQHPIAIYQHMCGSRQAPCVYTALITQLPDSVAYFATTWMLQANRTSSPTRSVTTELVSLQRSVRLSKKAKDAELRSPLQPLAPTSTPVAALLVKALVAPCIHKSKGRFLQQYHNATAAHNRRFLQHAI